MRVAAVVSSVVLFVLGVSIVAEADPLREVARIAYPVPLAFGPEDVVVGPQFLYLASTVALITVDRATGTEVSTVTLPDRATQIVPVVGGGQLSLLVVYGGQGHIFDLSDPAHPAHARVVESGCSGNELEFTPLPGRMQAVASAGVCAEVVDLASGQPVAALDDIVAGTSVASGGTSERPLVATLQGAWNRTGIIVYDLSDASRPYVLASWWNPASWRSAPELALDSTGTYLAVVPGPESWVFPELRDAVTGRLLASIPYYRAVRGVFLEGAGPATLALGGSGRASLWSFADLGAPLELSEWPALTDEWDTVDLVAAPGEPLLYSVDPAGTVLAVDGRTGQVAGRFGPFAATPQGLATGVLPADSRALAVRARHPSSASYELQLLDFTRVDAPRQGPLYWRPGTSFPMPLVPLAGAYVAVPHEGAIDLLHASTGRVVSTTPSEAVGVIGSNDHALLVTTTTTLIRYALEGERLVPHPVEYPQPEIVIATALAPDDAVVVLGGRWDEDWWPDPLIANSLTVVARDGSYATIPVEIAHWNLRDVLVSPDGTRVAAFNEIDHVHGGMVAFDVADRAAPRLAWSNDDVWPYEALWVKGGTALLAIWNPWWNYQHVGYTLLDPSTGAPLGDTLTNLQPRDFAAGLAFGSAERDRALLAFTSRGILLDVSGTTPRLMFDQMFGSAWSYLVPREIESCYVSTMDYVHDPTVALVGSDGSTTSMGIAPLVNAVAVRPGVLAGMAPGLPASVTIVRDLTLNHGPVADAGGSRTLECAGPAGTPATLDGSRSSDADSSPRTADDIVLWRWTLDGTPLADGVTASATLPLGAHQVELLVRDRVDAEGRTAATLTVADTRPPDVTVALTPVVVGKTFSGQWTPRASAADACDGTATVRDEVLALDRTTLDLPARWERGPEEVRVLPGEVVLSGADRATSLARWNAARTRGGFALRDGSPVTLQRGPATRTLVARYVFDATGAVTFARAIDPVVEARAIDAAGNVGTGRTTLSATINALCAASPGAIVCR